MWSGNRDAFRDGTRGVRGRIAPGKGHLARPIVRGEDDARYSAPFRDGGCITAQRLVAWLRRARSAGLHSHRAGPGSDSGGRTAKMAARAPAADARDELARSLRSWRHPLGKREEGCVSRWRRCDLDPPCTSRPRGVIESTSRNSSTNFAASIGATAVARSARRSCRACVVRPQACVVPGAPPKAAGLSLHAL